MSDELKPYKVIYKHETFSGTKQEYDDLPSTGKYYCPNCGLALTEPYPNCHCPSSKTGYGTMHINKWHHNCEHAMKRAYG